MNAAFLLGILFLSALVASAVVPPNNTIVADDGALLGGSNKHYLIKSGVSASAAGIKNTYYVESGGEVIQVTASNSVVYAELGAKVGRVSREDTVVYENQIIGDAFDGGWVWLHDSQTFFWSAETGDWYFYFPFWYGTVGNTQKLGVYPPIQKTK